MKAGTMRSQVRRNQSLMIQQQSQYFYSLSFVIKKFSCTTCLPSYLSTTSNINGRDIDRMDMPPNVATNQTIEEWFASIRKPPSFYAQHGGTRNRTPPDTSYDPSMMTPAQQIIASHQLIRQRCYFYNVDLHGRLYLEENPIKNITSSIKDTKFLDFFFGRTIYINEIHKEYMKQHNIPLQDYPFVSICQNEWNFIRPAATPIVFHSFIDSNEQYLLYGSSGTSMLREPFDEANGIFISKLSGKLYHKLTTHSYYPLSARKRYPSMPTQQLPQFALIRSSVALSLSHRIVESSEYNANSHSTGSRSNGDNNEIVSIEIAEPQPDNETHGNNDDATHQQQVEHKLPPKSASSGIGFISKCNRVFPIMYLPSYAEPGLYAMPTTE